MVGRRAVMVVVSVFMEVGCRFGGVVTQGWSTVVSTGVGSDAQWGLVDGSCAMWVDEWAEVGFSGRVGV